jgi:type VI protein secretion system component Hcp
MSTIVMMVPRDDAGSRLGRDRQTTIKNCIPGESQIDGFAGMLQVDSVEWQTDIENDDPTTIRRTIHLPKISEVKISRRVDGGTAVLTKFALTVRITSNPWELYFFKTLGEAPAPTAISEIGTKQNMHFRYLTMKLHNPLIVKYGFEFSESDAQESLEVSPTAIEWIYYQSDATQQKVGQVSVKYDVQKGKFVEWL